MNAYELRAEIDHDTHEALKKKSNLKAGLALLNTYSVLAATLALAFYMQTWYVTILAVIVLASRQLSLAVLMHECAHNSLFASKGVNQWVGKWLCGAPILVELDGYRKYHLQHHKLAGTSDDPDFPNYEPYPIKKASWRRKLIRDLLGVTGIKNLIGMVMMYAETNEFDLSYKPKKLAEKVRVSVFVKNVLRNMWPFIVVHLVFIALLATFDALSLYALWLVSYLTLFSVILRIRNAAEHASVPDLLSDDPRMNTRTTLAPWWQSWLFCPNGVNYHMEHHISPSVPAYNLRKLHRCLRKQGLIEGTLVSHGYGDVIRRLTAE